MTLTTITKRWAISLIILMLPVYAEAQTFITAAQKDSLDATYRWFSKNPPKANGANFLARWQHTAPLDRYGWQLSADTWSAYRKLWIKDTAGAAALEAANPILYYLRKATDDTYKDIRSTVVKRGAVIWKLYNMGYVVKTKDACFAMDLNQPYADKLVDVLDFAMVSHVHGDHNNAGFLNAMIKAGKKVFTPFYKPGTVITGTQEFTFGEVKVRFTMNMQAEVPVIVSQIDCGASAGNYTIYHIGDARLLEQLNPDRHVNLLVLHIQNAIDVFATNARVKPDVTVYDHVMELGHPVGQYRWSYQYTYDKIKQQPPAKSYVLTWGERLQIAK